MILTICAPYGVTARQADIQGETPLMGFRLFATTLLDVWLPNERTSGNL